MSQWESRFQPGVVALEHVVDQERFNELLAGGYDVDFEEGAVVSTDDTLYFGFGLGGVASPEKRAQVMGRSMDYLLGG